MEQTRLIPIRADKARVNQMEKYEITLSDTVFDMDYMDVLLGMLPRASREDVLSVLNLSSYITIDPRGIDAFPGQIVDENLYEERMKKIKAADYPAYCLTGAAGIKAFLAGKDTASFSKQLKELMDKEPGKGKKSRYADRLGAIEMELAVTPDFKPEDMFINSIIITAAANMDGTLYLEDGETSRKIQGVIEKSERLASLKELSAPNSIIKASRLALKSAVDELYN